MDKDKFFAGLREGLEELTKQAGFEGKENFVDDTIAELEKDAGFMDFLRGAGDHLGGTGAGAQFGEALAQSAGKIVPPLMAGLGIAAAARALTSVRNTMDYKKFERALQIATDRNPALKQADPERVKMYAESIFRVAPTVSQDPNVLAQVLVNAVRFETFDPKTLEMLANLEAKKNSEKPLTPKNLSL